MAKQRFINTHFWDDSYIVTLDPVEKLLFLYVLTNPLTNIAGAYEISMRRVEFDTGIDSATILRIFAKFASASRVEYRDGWILIKNFIKNQSMNPKIVKGIEEAVSHCPDWIKDRLSRTYQSLSHLNPNPNRDSNPNRTGAGLSASKPRSLPNVIESEINAWLDAAAPLTGAKSRSTMANAKGWREVVEAAVAEQRQLPDFLAAIAAERDRNKASPQFFTPQSVLKVLQAKSSSVRAFEPKRKTAREFQAEADARMELDKAIG